MLRVSVNWVQPGKEASRMSHLILPVVGTKKYTLTMYALSEKPKLDPEKTEVTRDVLLNAIKNTIIDSASLDVNYSRPE